MSKIKKIISGLLIVATLLPCFALAVGAKNVCKEVSGKTDSDGAVNTVFYVTTSNTKKHYVKMKMTKGLLMGKENLTGQPVLWWGQQRIYDFYEIKVYGKQKNGEYTEISKVSVRDKSSYKIEFKGYTDYKIKIYSWKVQTINNEQKYIREAIRRNRPQNVYWEEIPTWKISKTSGVNLCR